MKESEAKNFICKTALFIDGNGHAGEWEVYCKGSRCAKWRWSEPEADIFIPHCGSDFCGLITHNDKSMGCSRSHECRAWVDVNGDVYRKKKTERQGFCGLAGYEAFP